MNTLKSFLTLSFAMLCMTNTMAESISPKDKYVVIKNNSDRDIFYLYVSPETSDEWEEDVLGDDVLLAGDDITINLYGYEECLFDIKAIYDNDEEEIRWDVNVCSEDVEFYGVGSDDVSDKYVVVTNYSDRDIFYLYVSPETSDEWEEDVLGEDVLLAGDDIKINLYGYDECLFDIKAVYDNDETEVSWDVNVCIDDVEFYGVESDDVSDKYVVVTNYSNRDIFYLYVSPESSGDWEEDVLGEDVLLAGDDIKINLYGYDECTFDIKAVYDNDETEISWDVNVCIDDVEFYGN